MPTDTIILVACGLAAAVWSTGLVLWLTYLDNAQRRSTLYMMQKALASILERSGELRRQDRTPADIGI